MKISNEDRQFIEKYFSELHFYFQDEKIILRGTLSFLASYDKNKKKYTLYDPSAKISGKNIIKDSYEIEMDLSRGVNPYREVKEVGGKIIKVAKEKGVKSIVDLHIYKDGRVCVAGYLDEYVNIEFKSFFGDVIVPFFYDQSWYAKYDEWPRGIFAHSFLGLLENYAVRIKDIKESDMMCELTMRCIDSIIHMSELSLGHSESWKKLQRFINQGKIFRKKKQNRRSQCLCGSRKYFPLCHSEAFEGLVALKKNIKEFKLKNKL